MESQSGAESRNKKHKTQNKKAREKKEKRSQGKYLACIAGLVLVISASFLAPTAVFAVQDYYQAGSMELGERDMLELPQFNLEYEGELKARLENFAAGLAGGNEYYVVATEFKQGEVTLEEVEEALMANDAWIEYCFQLTGGAISWRFLGDVELVSCKKYVVLDGEPEAKIALSCIYAELHSDDYGDIYVLYDLEDYTIYYYEVEVSARIVDALDYLKYEVSYDKYYDNEELPYWIFYYYGNYYQSSIFLDEPEFEVENGIINGNVLKKVYDPEVNFSRLLKHNHVSYAVEIPFLEENLHVMMEMQHDAGEYTTIDAEVGLLEIGELIPDFNRD
ncbi:MAG: hypothetical protein NC417_09395 [Candidatus Gastranaerophilales bacterium]|nr:hypothetical protein [Candidatus Gastranaerophilales bacterium]